MKLGFIDLITMLFLIMYLKKTCDVDFLESILTCFSYIGIKYVVVLLLNLL